MGHGLSQFGHVIAGGSRGKTAVEAYRDGDCLDCLRCAPRGGEHACLAVDGVSQAVCELGGFPGR